MLAIAKDTAPKDLFRTVSITAQIFDEGTPAVDALILLTNGTVQTDLSNVIRMTRSDTAGIYRFSDLIPGSYGLAIFFNGSTTPEVFNSLFDNLQLDYISPGLDPTVSITTPVTTTPVIVDSDVVDITITNPGSGYSKNFSPILAYPGGFSAKTVIDDQGSIVSYEILFQGVATDVEETDSAVLISGEKILSEPREITYGEESDLPISTTWEAFYSIVDRASASFQSVLRSRVEFPIGSYGYSFQGLVAPYATAVWASKLIQRSVSYRANLNAPDNLLRYEIDFNVVPGPLVTFLAGSESSMSVLLNYDFFSIVGEIGGPICRVQTYRVISTSLSAQLTKIDPNNSFAIIPAVPDIEISPGAYLVYKHPFQLERSWVEQVFTPYVAKFYGSYSDYLISRIEQSNIYETLVRPALDPIPLQEGNSPVESSGINQEVESQDWQGWSNFVVNTFSNPYFEEQQQIYQSVKSKGHELLAQGLITEKEFNLAKGFMGRAQFVEPFLDGTFELPSEILPSRALTLIGIMAWQAKDALASGDIVDAIFDFSTQSFGAIALKPPNWVKETTFDVFDVNAQTTVQKRYINGVWQTVN
jgi:hypothetical protein